MDTLITAVDNVPMIYSVSNFLRVILPRKVFELHIVHNASAFYLELKLSHLAMITENNSKLCIAAI